MLGNIFFEQGPLAKVLIVSLPKMALAYVRSEDEKHFKRELSLLCRVGRWIPLFPSIS